MFSVFWIFISFLVSLKLITKLLMRKCNSNRCLINKTALITGGSTGIGYQKVLELASRGCKIIIADIEQDPKLIEKIVAETQNLNIIYKYLDLASNESIRRFAEEIKASEDKIDILIHNAGCVGFPYSKDGILRTLHVHCLGPFLLTHLLIDLLEKSSKARIVFVSSSLVFISSVKSEEDFNKPPPCGFLQSGVDYGNSKLFTLIISKEFAKRLKKYNITSNAVHPGACKTKIFQSFYETYTGNKTLSIKIFNFVLNLLLVIYGKSPEEAAQTALYCALSKDVENSTGKYYWNCQPFYEPTLAKNQQFCENIWKKSEKLVGLNPDECLK